MLNYTYEGSGSGVERFDFDEKHFDVKFKGSDKVYSYHVDNVGRHALDIMIELAFAGYGLCSYLAKRRRHK